MKHSTVPFFLATLFVFSTHVAAWTTLQMAPPLSIPIFKDIQPHYYLKVTGDPWSRVVRKAFVKRMEIRGYIRVFAKKKATYVVQFTTRRVDVHVNVKRRLLADWGRGCRGSCCYHRHGRWHCPRWNQRKRRWIPPSRPSNVRIRIDVSWPNMPFSDRSKSTFGFISGWTGPSHTTVALEDSPAPFFSEDTPFLSNPETTPLPSEDVVARLRPLLKSIGRSVADAFPSPYTSS